MTLAETIYQRSLYLPEPAAREALDFIEFLGQRYGATLTAPKALNDTEAFLAAVTGRLSDDFPDDGSGHEEIHAKNREIERQEAMAQLGKIRINFGGKPMTDREEANAR